MRRIDIPFSFIVGPPLPSSLRRCHAPTNRISDLSPTPVWLAQRARQSFFPLRFWYSPTPEDHARGFWWLELHNTCSLLLKE
jgi:hypothetical protein